MGVVVNGEEVDGVGCVNSKGIWKFFIDSVFIEDIVCDQISNDFNLFSVLRSP